jgi:hypothetical protein
MGVLFLLLSWTMGVFSLDCALPLYSKHDRKSTKLLLSYDTSSMTPNNSSSSSGSDDTKVSPKDISQSSKIAARSFCKLHASRSNPRDAHRPGAGINSQQECTSIDQHIIIRRQAHSRRRVGERTWGYFVEFSVLVSLEENKIIGEGGKLFSIISLSTLFDLSRPRPRRINMVSCFLRLPPVKENLRWTIRNVVNNSQTSQQNEQRSSRLNSSRRNTRSAESTVYRFSGADD